MKSKFLEPVDLIVIDDFLDVEDFKSIVRNYTESPDLGFRRVAKAVESDKDKLSIPEVEYEFKPLEQFVASSISTHLITPLLDKLGITDDDVLRCKVNFTSSTEENYANGWHCDLFDLKEDYTTAVLYLNTNNGGTMFPNGEKVESLANRFVSFDGDSFHTGYSHTGCGERIVLNINYIKPV